MPVSEEKRSDGQNYGPVISCRCSVAGVFEWRPSRLLFFIMWVSGSGWNGCEIGTPSIGWLGEKTENVAQVFHEGFCLKLSL